MHIASALPPLLAGLFACAQAGAAEPAKPATIEIGGEHKPAAAVIRAMTAGDTGCYLTLDDGTGGEATEQLAVFDLCEREAELVGKRVALGYAIESVLAAECQGDMDCGKSDQAVVVNQAVPVR